MELSDDLSILRTTNAFKVQRVYLQDIYPHSRNIRKKEDGEQPGGGSERPSSNTTVVPGTGQRIRLLLGLFYTGYLPCAGWVNHSQSGRALRIYAVEVWTDFATV